MNGSGGAVARRLRVIVPAVVVGVVFLLLWEWFVVARDIKPYLLPKPSAVWTQFKRQRTHIKDAAWQSGTNALVGLVIGMGFGVVMALISSRFKVFREMLVPLSAALNAMPIIALAPILNNAISSINSIPRRVVVAIVVFFPVFINVMRGLTQVDPVHAELLRSYAASDSAVLAKVRVPNALPFFFTAFKVAASLCVIAAVVAEYFGGPQNGLGSRISSNAAQTDTASAWAYVMGACLLGLAFYVASIVLERLAMPWRAKREGAAA